ncbi:Serine/arginine repetitive matrix protein 2 [Ceratobasidium theobromae]|uniref:Serine/arginine repetitive matrix protein 2 n=1 Tax=Ceratobasidium theobromae TaxID=1582974 RepID=A0A5N5QDI9_9AGAM|nr:Serine/arginine repetitive matrix protein 2 [Ceratobasidium theobromae]
MTFLSAPGDPNHKSQENQDDSQRARGEQIIIASHSTLLNQDTAQQLGPSLGLLHDDKVGSQPTDSKDVAILRRLKLAILEGQHPYFKANVDLSNLQDLVLTSGSRSAHCGAADVQESGLLDATMAQSNGQVISARLTPASCVGSPVPAAMDSRTGEGTNDSKMDDITNTQPGVAKMGAGDGMIVYPIQKVPMDSREPGAKPPTAAPGDLAFDNQPTTSNTLVQHTLLSPTTQESNSRESSHFRKFHQADGLLEFAHKENSSDTPTIIDPNEQQTQLEVQIKRESPPYQLSGSQPQGLDQSSSMSSFTSVSVMSTVLTSDDGGTSENSHIADADASGYNPKYGNRADYLRHQKARVKMLESIEEKNRRIVHRPEERPTTHKNLARLPENGIRRGTGPNVSPTRGRDHPSRMQTLPLPFRASDANTQGTSHASLRRTPPLDKALERPPPSFETSPRGRHRTSSFAQSPPGKYLPSRRPRDFSPSLDYRPQYLPYDDPRAARPRPVVSSPPRGSPPRETSAPRLATDRRSIDYNPFPRNESRSFDFRPPPPSPVFADRPSIAGSFGMDDDTTWASSARGTLRAPLPPPRNSPPPRDRDHTPFGSSSLPSNSNGYRPQGLPDPPSARYSTYEAPTRRADASWASPRDWDSAARSADSKPKLQDRLTMEPTWSRDGRDPRSREEDYGHCVLDNYEPRGDDLSHFRREASPPTPRYSEGFRAGFDRRNEMDEVIRPMKRSRPSDGYAPRGGPSADRVHYDLDSLPADYYGREPLGRVDDGYDRRPRPNYSDWANRPQ